MITKHFKVQGLRFVSKMYFGHGHAPKPYDWRDDPSANSTYEQDLHQIGVKDPM